MFGRVGRGIGRFFGEAYEEGSHLVDALYPKTESHSFGLLDAFDRQLNPNITKAAFGLSGLYIATRMNFDDPEAAYQQQMAEERPQRQQRRPRDYAMGVQGDLPFAMWQNRHG